MRRKGKEEEGDREMVVGAERREAGRGSESGSFVSRPNHGVVSVET